MPIKRKNVTPKPKGYVTYDSVEVAGIPYRKPAALRFAKGRNQWLEWEREPNNRHDRNAIKIYGCTRGLFGTRRRFIGYVPAETARRIVDSGLWGLVLPHFQSLYVDDVGVAPGDEFIEITFQVLGPGTRKNDYTGEKKPSLQ